MELTEGFEPSTAGLQNRCSTTELRQLNKTNAFITQAKYHLSHSAFPVKHIQRIFFFSFMTEIIFTTFIDKDATLLFILTSKIHTLLIFRKSLNLLNYLFQRYLQSILVENQKSFLGTQHQMKYLL